jgi:hypothetical protein
MCTDEMNRCAATTNCHDSSCYSFCGSSGRLSELGSPMSYEMSDPPNWCEPFLFAYGSGAAVECGLYRALADSLDANVRVLWSSACESSVRSCESSPSGEFCSLYCGGAWTAGFRPTFCNSARPNDIPAITDCFPSGKMPGVDSNQAMECCAKHPETITGDCTDRLIS